MRRIADGADHRLVLAIFGAVAGLALWGLKRAWADPAVPPGVLLALLSFLLVYPALAILAAIVIDRVRILLSGYFAKPIYGGLLIVGLMALSAFWSVPMAYENMIHERFLLLKPF
mgnify:CR=1 FL=1